MTCQVILEMIVKEGRYDELRSWLIENLPGTPAFECNVSVEPVRDQDDPRKLFLLEKWESRAHFERYVTWRDETGILDELDAMTDGGLESTVLDFVGV